VEIEVSTTEAVAILEIVVSIVPILGTVIVPISEMIVGVPIIAIVVTSEAVAEEAALLGVVDGAIITIAKDTTIGVRSFLKSSLGFRIHFEDFVIWIFAGFQSALSCFRWWISTLSPLSLVPFQFPLGLWF
jgi:hypothetical protein